MYSLNSNPVGGEIGRIVGKTAKKTHLKGMGTRYIRLQYTFGHADNTSIVVKQRSIISV